MQPLRIALFGGTFDPIHNAHLTVAREACARFSLDRVLFIPAANPPHKVGHKTAPYEHRLRMVEIAAEGNPAFVASDLEAGTVKSYSIETIERARALLAADDSLFFLIGADAFAEIGTWYRWQEVIASVEFIVVTRPGHDYQIPEGARVHKLDTVALPVSSSEIRRQLGAGERPADLPSNVVDYICLHGLYGFKCTQ
jgi:nicotinate-nucleotide adenylyltransferase